MPKYFTTVRYLRSIVRLFLFTVPLDTLIKPRRKIIFLGKFSNLEPRAFLGISLTSYLQIFFANLFSRQVLQARFIKVCK